MEFQCKFMSQFTVMAFLNIVSVNEFTYYITYTIFVDLWYQQIFVIVMLNKNTWGVKKCEDKGGQVTKPIILVKICYKLLYVIQGV